MFNFSEKSIINIILSGDKQNSSPLISGTRQLCSFSLRLVKIVLEILANAIRNIGSKEEVKLFLLAYDVSLYIEEILRNVHPKPTRINTSLVRSEYARSIYKNQFYFYKLTMNNPK